MFVFNLKMYTYMYIIIYCKQSANFIVNFCKVDAYNTTFVTAPCWVLIPELLQVLYSTL